MKIATQKPKKPVNRTIQRLRRGRYNRLNATHRRARRNGR
jgi:hypothetical protein